MIRRRGTRGMGDPCNVSDADYSAAACEVGSSSASSILPACSSITKPPSFQGPVLCQGSQSDIKRAVTQSQIDALWDYVSGGPAATPSAQWIAGIPNAYVAIGGAVLLALLFGAMGGRR